MPLDFDFDEQELQAAIAPEPLAPKPQAVQQSMSHEVDSELHEAEQRLEMAQYYKLLLSDSIFQDPPNAAVAEVVETEIRGFIRERLGVLLGIKSQAKAEVPQQFSPEEAAALRTLATPEVLGALNALLTRLLKKPAILDVTPTAAKPAPAPKAPPKEPTLRKVGRAPEPKPAPAPRPAAPEPPKKGGQQRVYKKVVRADGKEVTLDVTPQARPVGNIQPKPVGSVSELQVQYEMAARQSADVGLQAFEKALKNRS